MPYSLPRASLKDSLLLIAVLLFAVLVYWPGLSGGYIFDDFGNLVDNAAMAPEAVRAHFWAAVWSSGSGPTDRPISMLTFALQDWFTGLAPWPFKFVNLLIHLANGVLVFMLVRAVVGWVFVAGAAPFSPRGANTPPPNPPSTDTPPPQPSPIKGEGANAPLSCAEEAPPPLWGRGWGGGAGALTPSPLVGGVAGRVAPRPRTGWGGGAKHWLITPNTLALLIAAAWLLAPMQLTAVLYVIQRMESLASFFILSGLLLYWQGRMRLIAGQAGGWWRIWAGLIGGTLLATFAKES